MLNSHRHAWFQLMVLAGLVPLISCIAHAPGSGGGGGGGSQTTTITIKPANPTVSTNPPGNTVQFSFTGTSNVTSVAWYLDGNLGGAQTPQGTLDQSGLYTAPMKVPNPNTVTVYAVDAAGNNNTQSNTVTITISPATNVSISPTPIFLPVSGTSPSITATVNNTTNTAVTWSLSPAGFGTLTSSGITATYTAPANLPATLTGGPYPVAVTATSVDDPSQSASATVNVHMTVTINAPPSAIGTGEYWQYTATANGISASQNQGMNWSSYSPSPGSCNSGAGSFPYNVDPTLDPPGLYFAPQCVPGAAVTITATSQFDPTVNTTAQLRVQQSDAVGTATSTTIACPSGGATGATCYKLNTSCADVANFNAYLKVNQPTGTPLGTIILGTGQGGANALYDNDPAFISGTFNGGLFVVDGILNSGASNQGFTAVQVSFGSPFDTSTGVQGGWLTGPGGVRRLACRYAAVAQWVYTNIHKANAGAPMCAIGNDGGASAVAYALTDYGQSNIFAMVEATSGPTMTRLDEACVPASQGTTAPFTCNAGDPSQNLPFNYALDEAAVIDPAYPAPYCSNAINGGGTQAPGGVLLSDSILGGTQPPTVTPVYVNILVGGKDTSSAVIQSSTWGQALGLTPTQRACVEDAPLSLPSVQDGASQIVSDIQNLCKLP